VCGECVGPKEKGRLNAAAAKPPTGVMPLKGGSGGFKRSFQVYSKGQDGAIRGRVWKYPRFTFESGGN